jgi:hypothetical protein
VVWQEKAREIEEKYRATNT